MTILQSLDRYYGRMAARGEAEAPGWSNEPIGTIVILDPNGSVVDVSTHLDDRGKRPRSMPVPKPFNRQGTGSTPYLLWDNTAYALGVSEKDPAKTARDHAASRDLHLRLLAGATDPALASLRRFFEEWRPEMFRAPFETRMLAWNLVFRLDGVNEYIHEGEAARGLIDDFRAKFEAEGVAAHANQCLVTGRVAPPRITHTKIKGVPGTSNPEVPFVSFNQEAFESYGKRQAENAPVSGVAVARYTAALTALLDRERGRNRLPRGIGDATVAFWADASELLQHEERKQAAEAADEVFLSWFDPPNPASGPERNLDADGQEAAKLRDQLEKVAEGRPEKANPKLRPGTRFHVLGLAPNAARLSVRYWLDDDFSAFAKRLLEHAADMQIEPPPYGWGARPPDTERFLLKTVVPSAITKKGLWSKSALEYLAKNQPLLGGEQMRAILSGTRYPRTLLAACLIRLRAGDDPGSGWHAAAIRGVLERDRRLKQSGASSVRREGTPVSLDREHHNTGYQLGRLFAVYELAQVAALGRKVNSTIRDKYFGAASAAPASIFPLIIANGQNHLSKVRKEKPGWAYLIEKELEEVMGRFDPRMPRSLPRSLRLEDQGEFAIGYYHQRRAKLGDGKVDQPSLDLNQGEDGDDE